MGPRKEQSLHRQQGINGQRFQCDRLVSSNHRAWRIYHQRRRRDLLDLA